MSRSAVATPGPTELSVAYGVPLAEEPGLGALTLPGYLREVTERFADREALVLHRQDRIDRWSYADLWAHANAIARALAAGGVGKDTRVGVMMTNRPEWVAAFFGIGLAGGVAVPLSTFSTEPELEHLLQVSGVEVLLFEREVLKKDFIAMLVGLEPKICSSAPGALASPRFPFLRRLAAVDHRGEAAAVESWDEFLASGQQVNPKLIAARAESTSRADLAAIFFSSGSTGKPKGVLSAHQAIAIQCWRWARMYRLGDDVRCWSPNGFFWSGNLAMALGSTLSSGGACVLQPTFDAAEALRLFAEERVTLPIAWPHQWAQLRALPDWDDADLSSFRYVDPVYTAGQRSVSTEWGDPRWTYGNTEAFTIVTCYPSGTPEEVAGDSHGEALPGNVIKIVDPITGETLPVGRPGEVAVKGATLMLGYLGAPLAETLDPEGFFRTGDGGWLDDRGRLHWEGRLNDIIKTGGANVSPLEVDAALSACPGVKVNMTVGVPHETLGEMVVACVVPREGASLSEEGIREHLKSRLASYKLPRRVLFVSEQDLSLTGSAKLRSVALRELAAKRLQGEAGAALMP